MKFLVISSLLFTVSAFASTPRLVSGQFIGFSGAEISYYLTVEVENSILAKSIKICGSNTVDTISNISVQVDGSFKNNGLDNKHKSTAIGGLLSVVYTALVTCN